jgi:hypothetical protein
MGRLFGIALAVVIAGASVGHAAEESKDVVKADTSAAFAVQAADVRKAMQPDGRYAFVTPDEHVKVDAALDRMGALFEANGSVMKMDKATQVELFNAQESVNAILTLRDRDRLICRRGTTTGSRVVSTSCRTYGELESERQASNKFMLDRIAVPCSNHCNGN